MLEGLSPVHLIVILVVALLILGPGKLPETGAALGKAFREFRSGLDGSVPSAPTSVAADPVAPAATSRRPRDRRHLDNPPNPS